MSLNHLPVIIKNLIPASFRTFRIDYLNRILKKKFISANSQQSSQELKKIINYLRNNKFCCFPYDFTKNYRQPLEINFDPITSHLAVNTSEQIKLFFPKKYSAQNAATFYNWILMEQDPASPHKYTTDHFSPDANSVVLDIGSAEGLFALTHLRNAQKVLVIEKDPSWLDALKITFGQLNLPSVLYNKCEVIEKYIAKEDTENTITIETLLKGRLEPDSNIFLKMDIEGMEYEVLKSSENFLRNSPAKIKIALACYHYHHDAERLQLILNEWGFKTSFSDGYILTYMNGMHHPYYRKCILRAER